MATHGYMWIPLDPKVENSDMLFCEAWSNGYIDNVGLGVWSSSKNIETISKLNQIFAGSPWFFDYSTGGYRANEADYILEGYEDCIDDDNENKSEVLESAEETLNLIESNDLEAAFDTYFSKIPLKEKIEDLDIGLNVYVSTSEKVWSDFTANCSILTNKEVVDLCVNDVKKLKSGKLSVFSILDFDYEYVWHSNQFWIKDRNAKLVMPLIFAHIFNGHDSGYVGNLGYLADMTVEDNISFKVLLEKLKEKNIPLDILFGGTCVNMIGSVVKKVDCK